MTRTTKKQQVKEYFTRNMGKVVSSYALHQLFGTATRARISEINLDNECPIEIVNSFEPYQGKDQSIYRSQYRIGACSDCDTKELHVATITD